MGFDSVTPLVPQAASSVFFLVGGAGPIPAMAYESIPAAEDGLLLKTPKPKTTSLKSLVACAAIASFVLGIVAATAVTQHAIARQTNLKTTAAGLVNRAYSSPTSEEYCGGQWGFALAFGRKDAKNQCPPGESDPPPSPSLSLSVCLLIPNRDSLFLVRRFPVRQNQQHLRAQRAQNYGGARGGGEHRKSGECARYAARTSSGRATSMTTRAYVLPGGGFNKRLSLSRFSGSPVTRLRIYHNVVK